MVILYILLTLLLLLGTLFVLIRFSPPFKRWIGKYFYDWLYGLQWEQSVCNNYGYAPTEPDALRLGGTEPYQHQLYAELAKAIPRAEWLNLRLLEVGCGRGGGIRFLQSTLQPAITSGLDFSQNAIAYSQALEAKRPQGIHYQQGDAHDLPFPDNEFDVVINVESSHIYADQAAFFREVHRVLVPGGKFIVADYRLLGAEGIDRMHHDLKMAALSAESSRDISDAVLEACRQDSPRREAMIAKSAPSWTHWYLRDFAMVAGSREFEQFKRTYQYFIEVWKK